MSTTAWRDEVNGTKMPVNFQDGPMNGRLRFGLELLGQLAFTAREIDARAARDAKISRLRPSEKLEEKRALIAHKVQEMRAVSEAIADGRAALDELAASLKVRAIAARRADQEKTEQELKPLSESSLLQRAMLGEMRAREVRDMIRILPLSQSGGPGIGEIVGGRPQLITAPRLQELLRIASDGNLNAILAIVDSPVRLLPEEDLDAVERRLAMTIEPERIASLGRIAESVGILQRIYDSAKADLKENFALDVDTFGQPTDPLARRGAGLPPLEKDDDDATAA